MHRRILNGVTVIFPDGKQPDHTFGIPVGCEVTIISLSQEDISFANENNLLFLRGWSPWVLEGAVIKSELSDKEIFTYKMTGKFPDSVRPITRMEIDII